MLALVALGFLQLVGDPLRWQLLVELARSDRRVGELTALNGKPQNLVSYHLGELRRAGLVSARRSSADGRDTYYRVDVGRCSELLCAAGAALQPGLRLGPLPPTRRRLEAGAAGAVPVHGEQLPARRWPRPCFEQRSGGTDRGPSAGSHPKTLHPDAVRVMAERGIDISGRPTKHLDRFARTRFDQVITLCDKVREICPEFPGPPITSHWSMPDPAARDTDEPAIRRSCAPPTSSRPASGCSSPAHRPTA